MKWILITNPGNPGDEFVRLGVARMVREVDPKATFRLFWRDGPHSAPEPFDRAVVCGMPLLWSNGTSSTTDHLSWPPLVGWLSESRQIALAGVGSYLIRQNKDWWMDPEVAKTVRRDLVSRCRMVYTRDPVTAGILGAPAMACPSVLAGKGLPRSRDLRLTNLMPTLAHYPQLTPGPSELWSKLVRPVADILKSHGFCFIAHSDAEMEFAKVLGWPANRLFVYQRNENSLQALLRIYSSASHYVGNRIHGAIVSRGFGAATLCIGSDSRLEAVRQVGGETMFPEPTIPSWLSSWISERRGCHFPADEEYKKQLDLFTSFL